MRKTLLFFFALAMVLGWTSCVKDDYMAFVGTWGVDRIDYYNIDFYGQPIEGSLKTYHFTPGDFENGIELVFRDDRTGEMRDHSRDTVDVPVYDEWNELVDTLHVAANDTTIVTGYTYSYHDDDATLYLNIETVFRFFRRTAVSDNEYKDSMEEVDRKYTYQLRIEMLTNDSFIYVNEYDKDYVEKARLMRISNEARGSKSLKPSHRPGRPGSLLSGF